LPDCTSNTSLAPRQPKVFFTSICMITMGSSASSADVKAGSEYAALRR
jgi:hypothetical protein